MLSARVLRTVRSEQGLSQRAFAERLGLAQSVVARYETGAVAPSLEKLQEMLEEAGFAMTLRIRPKKGRTHRLHELRSLEYHRLVAAAMAENGELLERGRKRVEDWLSGERVFAGDLAYARAWRKLLRANKQEVMREVVAENSEMRELRQNSPFSGMLGPAIWQGVVAALKEEPEVVVTG